VAQLYPRALGSLFVASYDSQSYGGSILTRLHTGIELAASWSCLQYLDTNYVGNVSSIIAAFSCFAVETCLLMEPILSNGGCVVAYLEVDF
jgi:hypothetical protein